MAADLSRILLSALQTEIHGEHFYRMAAAAVQDSMGQQALLLLAEDEKLHAAQLSQLLQAVTQQKEQPQINEREPPSSLISIFSDTLQERIKDAHAEMSVLATGIELERSAMVFYREQAKALPGGSAAKLFETLARWEAQHYESLMAHYDQLKESYWQANGFSPF